MSWYYTFEAKEIQSFILQSDKLREMVGGSELVSRLCGSFLHDALKALGVHNPEQIIIANAAGWARIEFHSEETAREFARYWPMMVSRYAPGLRLIQTLIQVEGTLPEALAKSIARLRSERNCNEVSLPETTPLQERNPRTGTAAVRLAMDKKAKSLVPLDRQTIRKRELAKNHSSLTKRLSGQFNHEDWPYEIEEIASGKSAYVAVIHADGNDLGSILMRIGDHLKNAPQEAYGIYRELSRVIDDITVGAAREASEKVLFPDYLKRAKPGCTGHKIAARPIVLGGDDLTIIVRADLALQFTATFLEAFERMSDEKFAGLRSKIKNFPKAFTACAGIAFVKKSYPFASAYHLAESLCDHTKKQAKADRDRRKKGEEHIPVPSSCTWHRVTTSMSEGFSEVKQQELTGRGKFNGKPLRFWYGPFATGAFAGDLPLLSDLYALAQSVKNLPGGSVRTLIATMHTDPVTARKDYERILEVAGKEKADALRNSLEKLTGSEETPLWDKEQKTPLADAHLLCEVEKGGIDA